MFTLTDGGTELADILFPLQLPPLGENERRKLTLRQVAAARTRRRGAINEVSLSSRSGLLQQAQDLAIGNPGLQDLIADRLVLRPEISVEQVEAALKEVKSYLNGGDLPKYEQIGLFLEGLQLDMLLKQAGDANKALLRAATLFQLPVPSAVLETLAAQLGGTPDDLRRLGLLDPFEDLVDPQLTALAVNRLAASRLDALSEKEVDALARLSVYALLSAWLMVSGGRPWPSAADVELTRLALLCGDADIVNKFSPLAVTSLVADHRLAQAVEFGQSAIALLEERGRPLPLELLAATSHALGRTGDGELRASVLAKGTIDDRGNLGTTSDLRARSAFLLERGTHEAQRGDEDAALATFEEVRKANLQFNDNFVALSQGWICEILVSRGELDEAMRRLREEVLPIFQRSQDERCISITQSKIAEILIKQQKLDEAMHILRDEALPIFKRIGDPHAIALQYGRIADILEMTDPDEALRTLRQDVIPVFTDLGDVRGVGRFQRQVANILSRRGDLKEALRIWNEEVLPVYIRSGDFESANVINEKIADALVELREFTSALEIFRKSIIPYYERHYDKSSAMRRKIANALIKVADIFIQANERQVAISTLNTVVGLLTAPDDLQLLLEAQSKLGDTLVLEGKLDAALEVRIKQLETSRTYGSSDNIAFALWDAAQVEIQLGKVDDGVARLPEAWQRLLEIDRADGIAVVGEVYAQAMSREDAESVLRRSAEAYRSLGLEADAQRVEADLLSLPPSA